MQEHRVAAFTFVEDRIVLVKTRGSGARIPPGGKLEAGETGAQAARREAREEAGVVGELCFASKRPVGRYVHETTRSGKQEVTDIYVLIANPQGFRPNHAEPQRKPKLYSRDEAIARVTNDVSRKRRPTTSEMDLVAAIETAFAFLDELRRGSMGEMAVGVIESQGAMTGGARRYRP